MPRWVACPQPWPIAIFRHGPLPAPPRLAKLRAGAQENDSVTAARIAVPLALAVAFAFAALAAAPRAFEAQLLLAAQDDPAALADHAVARAFNADAAAREIDAALAADDADLAMSFLDLARERNLPIDPALAEKLERANAGTATAARTLASFARGLVVGEAADISGLAGTAVGDLFALGDVRDALREGTRLAAGGDGGNLRDGRRGRARARGPDRGQDGAQDRPARRTYGRMDRPLAARGRRLDGAQARRQRRKHCRARGRHAWRARSGQGRKGARTCAARRRRGTCAGQRRNASGTRRIKARRRIARHVEDRAARCGQGRQDPRDPQARGPRRHRPHGGHLQPRDVAVLGGRDAPRFCFLAQAYGRTDHRTLLRAPQASPRALRPRCAACADPVP